MSPSAATILSIVPFPFLPPKKGGDWCAYYTCHFLAANYPMLVATTQAPEYPANFEAQKAFEDTRWKYLSYKTAQKLLKMAKEWKVSTLFLHQPFMGPMAYYVSQKLNIPLMVYVHNLEYQRFKSLNKPWWRLLYYWEKFLYKKSDLLLFISDTEMEEAVATLGVSREKCLHTPYGVLQNEAPIYDQTECKKSLGLDLNKPVFLFFGSMSYAPNAEAVELLLEKVAPIWRKKGIEAQWLICGGGLPVALQKKISEWPDFQYLGFVEDLDSYIKAADLMLNPVLSGGGVKTKVMESLGWGTTVISTESGALGIDRSYCQIKLLVNKDNDWEGFVNSMTLSLVNIEKPLSKEFYQQYSWEVIMRQVTVRLKTILTEG